ncbi:hypothetical protein C3F09_09455, partial [candidate division GN15 bacterium]
MKKTLGFLVMLTALVAVVAMVAQAAVRPANPRLQQAVDMKPVKTVESVTGASLNPMARFAPVGMAAAKPTVDSRGALISQTYNDVPGNVSPGNLVAVPDPGADQAGVYFGYRAKAAGGDPSDGFPASINRMGYSAFDPLTNTYPNPGGIVIIADASPTSVEGGSTARVLAYPDGRAIVTGYSYPDNDGPDVWIQVAKEFAPFGGAFGDILTGGSIMLNDTNIAQSWTTGAPSWWPSSVLDINGSGANDTVIYLLTHGGITGRWYGQDKVFRKIGTSMPNGNDNSWTVVFTDSTYGFHGGGIACDPTSARVAIFNTLPVLTDTTGGHGENVRWADSPTG